MVRKFIKLLAFCLLFITSIGVKSQEAGILKAFINENDVAIRSVQKYSINLSGQETDTNIKELLKLQMASAKLFTSNSGKSADIAFMVRGKCKEFLLKHSKGSLEYLELTDKEQAFFTSPKPVDKISSFLTRKELEKVNAVDTKDPHLFDDLNTRIK
jgi:hypothetical protein